MLKQTCVIRTLYSIPECIQRNRQESAGCKSLRSLYFVQICPVRRMDDKMIRVTDFKSTGSRDTRNSGSAGLNRMDYAFNQHRINKASCSIMNQDNILRIRIKCFQPFQNGFLPGFTAGYITAGKRKRGMTDRLLYK